MRLGRVVALIADVHGDARALGRALATCRVEGVETVALLGDLFDRVDHAHACAQLLSEWHVIGVYGNHEREVAARAEAELRWVPRATARLLSALRDEVVIDGVCFKHEAHWVDPPWARASTGVRERGVSGHASLPPHLRILFVGHTHVRHARDEFGVLDVARGVLRLHPGRRYVINPGALSNGQFAIWHRQGGIVRFFDIGES